MDYNTTTTLLHHFKDFIYHFYVKLTVQATRRALATVGGAGCFLQPAPRTSLAVLSNLVK